MNTIKTAFTTVYKIANIPIDLFGYTITFWQLFMYVAIGSLVIWFLRKMME